jgi:hypothetical protein
MNSRLSRSLKILFCLSCAATFVLYAAHPADPKPHADLRAYLGFSGPWHQALFAVCILQLVCAAALFGAGASARRTMPAAGLLLTVGGLNADLIHAAAEGFVFPSMASAMSRDQLFSAVASMNAAPAVVALTIVGMAAAEVGLLILALSKENVRSARILAGAAAILLPLPILVPGAFDVFAIAAYGALATAALALPL